MAEPYLARSRPMLNPISSRDQLDTWVERARNQALQGQVNQRIPLLAVQNPALFAVRVEGPGEILYVSGDTHHCFPLMSVVKPFLLLYLLTQLGQEPVFQWVGMSPSDAPFNSLEQLVADNGRPRNPMINSGAIALSSHLPGQDAEDACDRFCEWLNRQAQSNLFLDNAMLASVRQAGREPNQALLRHLLQAGQIHDPDRTLDSYERLCCLSGNVADLTRLGYLLAFESSAVAYADRCAVNALMLTCGLYEASPTYAVRVGLPLKSGIGGALLAIVPGQGILATYSPALDSRGNPRAGLAFVAQAAQALQLSCFA